MDVCRVAVPWRKSVVVLSDGVPEVSAVSARSGLVGNLTDGFGGEGVELSGGFKQIRST